MEDWRLRISGGLAVAVRCGADRVDFVCEVICEVRLGVSEMRHSRLFYEFVKF